MRIVNTRRFMSTKTGKQARRNKETEGTDYFLYIAAVAVASKASQKPFKSAVLSVSRRGGSSFGFLKSCQRAKKLMIVIVMSVLGSRSRMAKRTLRKPKMCSSVKLINRSYLHGHRGELGVRPVGLMEHDVHARTVTDGVDVLHAGLLANHRDLAVGVHLDDDDGRGTKGNTKTLLQYSSQESAYST